MSIFGSVNIRGAGTDLDAWVSTMHSLLTCDPVRLVGPLFPSGSTIDTNFYTTSTSGTGATAALASGIVSLEAADDSAAYARIITARKARFMFAAPNLFRSLIRIPTANVGHFAYWGALDPTGWSFGSGDLAFGGGFYFSLDGLDGTSGRFLKINYHNGTSLVAYRGGITPALGHELNGDVSSYLIDDNYHAYEIMYFMAAAYFFVDGVYVGSLTPTTEPFTVLNVPACVVTFNWTGVGVPIGNKDVHVAAMSILRLGQEHTLPKTMYLNTTTDTLLKRGSGELHRVVVTDTGGSAFTIYDNTTNSGTILAVIDPAKTVGTLDLGAQFEIGLYIDFGAVAPKITVVYE